MVRCQDILVRIRMIEGEPLELPPKNHRQRGQKQVQQEEQSCPDDFNQAGSSKNAGSGSYLAMLAVPYYHSYPDLGTTTAKVLLHKADHHAAQKMITRLQPAAGPPYGMDCAA